MKNYMKYFFVPGMRVKFDREGSIFILLTIVISLIPVFIPLIVDINVFLTHLSAEHLAYEQQRYLLDGIMNAAVSHISTLELNRDYRYSSLPYRNEKIEARLNVQKRDNEHLIMAELIKQGRTLKSLQCTLYIENGLKLIKNWHYQSNT